MSLPLNFIIIFIMLVCYQSVTPIVFTLLFDHYSAIFAFYTDFKSKGQLRTIQTKILVVMFPVA